MISGISAGSSSSSTAWIGLSFAVADRSGRAMTNAVVRFVPKGTSTRDPRRTSSRRCVGIVYVKVPCTATGTATSANSARPGIGNSMRRGRGVSRARIKNRLRDLHVLVLGSGGGGTPPCGMDVSAGGSVVSQPGDWRDVTTLADRFVPLVVAKKGGWTGPEQRLRRGGDGAASSPP